MGEHVELEDAGRQLAETTASQKKTGKTTAKPAGAKKPAGAWPRPDGPVVDALQALAVLLPDGRREREGAPRVQELRHLAQDPRGERRRGEEAPRRGAQDALRRSRQEE